MCKSVMTKNTSIGGVTPANKKKLKKIKTTLEKKSNRKYNYDEVLTEVIEVYNASSTVST